VTGLTVSIITPSLNQGAFLAEALASVRAQTYGNVEHLVVDGGSSDETLEILGRSDGIRWVSEPDAGMYDALNKGLQMSTGLILGYLNCDDAYPPWAIEVAVKTFESDPSIDVVYGDGLAVDLRTNRQRLSLIPPFDRRWLALSGSLVQPAVFWRRRAYEASGGFDPGLRFVGDLDYWLRLGAGSTFRRVDEVLAIERHHEGALSTAWADRMAAEEALMRERHHGLAGGRHRLGIVLARVRAAWWRRRLLLSFLVAARGRTPRHRWPYFLADGAVRLSARHLVLAMIPRLGARFAWGAVTSGRDWFATPDAAVDGRRPRG
jgi:glycosyltransferase involved in cell wall biosynthesis